MTKIKRIMSKKVSVGDSVYVLGKWRKVTYFDNIILLVHLDFGFDYIDVYLPPDTIVRVQREEVNE